MSDHGTYIEAEGRPAVRFERFYPVGIDRLWAAITQPGELEAWFPSAVEHEGVAGGRITFEFGSDAPMDSDTILVWEPPHRFAFGWGGDEIHFEVTAHDAGSKLVLVNVLAATDTAARNAAGWYVCLDQLAGSLSGAGSAAALPWQPVYEAHIADGIPSGAPIPD